MHHADQGENMQGFVNLFVNVLKASSMFSVIRKRKFLLTIQCLVFLTLVACSTSLSTKTTLKTQVASSTVDAEGNSYFGTVGTSSTYQSNIFFYNNGSPYTSRTDTDNYPWAFNGSNLNQDYVNLNTYSIPSSTSTFGKYIKFESKSDSTNQRYSRRTEMKFETLLVSGTERYSRFRVIFPGNTAFPTPEVKIPNDTVYPQDEWIVFHQWWQLAPLNPAIAFEIKPTPNQSSSVNTDPLNLTVSLRNNAKYFNPVEWPSPNYQWMAKQTGTDIRLYRDVWYTFVVYTSFDATHLNDSRVKVWMEQDQGVLDDNDMILCYIGKLGYKPGTTVNGTVVSSTQNKLTEKFGVYRSVAPRNQPSNATLWYDDLRFGTQRADVDLSTIQLNRPCTQEN
jgi:hypothetical protein